MKHKLKTLTMIILLASLPAAQSCAIFSKEYRQVAGDPYGGQGTREQYLQLAVQYDREYNIEMGAASQEWENIAQSRLDAFFSKISTKYYARADRIGYKDIARQHVAKARIARAKRNGYRRLALRAKK